MKARLLPFLAALAIVLTATPALADESERFEARAKSLSTLLAKRALDRARRALVLGPHVGVAPSYTHDGDSGFRGSVGLSLLYLDVPIIPTQESLTAILKHHAGEQFVAELKSLVEQGRGASEEERRALAEKVWQDVVDEFLLKYHAKRFEKPKLATRLSARRLSSDGASAWEIGFTAGLGVGPVYVSAGPVVQVNNGSGLNAELELALPMTLSKGLRSPTVEFFLAVSIAGTKRDERPDRTLLGARIMLDVL